ncbi:MAG: hypothetical protein E7379_03475 [Clostridiales bacterium]|nr:hypothetical protein [Clostridiales bacterium]
MKGKYTPPKEVLPDVEIRYGKQENIENIWKEISQEPDVEQRKVLIDNLVGILEQNSEKNGFYGNQDIVDCGANRGFKIDDKEIYYIFFDYLKQIIENNLEAKPTDGAIINKAIRLTIDDYNAKEKKYDYKVEYKTSEDDIEGRRRELRLLLTEKTYDQESDDFICQSIDRQRGHCCLLCTEKSAIAHNLWLLTGATSYHCLSKSENLAGGSMSYERDSHHFTIVEYDNKFRLYDVSMNNFCMLENDCVDNMLSGKGLAVQNVQNPGVYAKNYVDKESSIADFIK